MNLSSRSIKIEERWTNCLSPREEQWPRFKISDILLYCCITGRQMQLESKIEGKFGTFWPLVALSDGWAKIYGSILRVQSRNEHLIYLWRGVCRLSGRLESGCQKQKMGQRQNMKACLQTLCGCNKFIVAIVSRFLHFICDMRCFYESALINWLTVGLLDW